MNSLNLLTEQERIDLLKYFEGDELAAIVWLDKYALKDEDGSVIETLPSDMHWRMAKQFAKAELNNPKIPFYKRKKLSKYGRERFSSRYTAQDFYTLLENFKGIIPGGSMMSNLGNPGYGSTSNCFFVALEDDSMEAIFKVGAQLASIFKYRGGCGINISKLRPAGANVHNSAKTSSGAVSFAPLFSEVARVVGQEGRRAALMVSISSDHPDVLEFIRAKQNQAAVTTANISVQMSDEFMMAALRNRDYFLRWSKKDGTDFEPAEYGIELSDLEYDKLMYFPEFDIYIKKVKAKEIYDELVKNAHATAEPGILFWNTTLDYSLSAYYPQYREQGTNPCGEIPLADKDACRLFALNLSTILHSDLYMMAYEQLVMADLSIDIEDKRIQAILDKIGDKKSIEYQLWKGIKETAISGRRVGCGITGLFEVISRKLKNTLQNEEDVIRLVDAIFKTKMEAELDATIDLAILKGTFKGYTSKECGGMIDLIREHFPEQHKRMQKYGRRNVSFSTIAPTGTISVLTGTTSGIEPLFAPYYIRRKKVTTTSTKVDNIDVDGEKFTNHYVVHKGLIQYAKMRGYEINESTNWEKIFNESYYKNWTSADINPDLRIKIQSVAQTYTTHSISSTLNLPESTPISTVEDIFNSAFVNNLKGVTIYREGSRSGVLVTQDSKPKVDFPQHDAPKRPQTLQGELHIAKAQGETYAVIIGLLEGKPYEVFAALSQDYKPQKGQIVKIKRGVYRWIGADGTIIENLNILSEFSTERMLTLTISMLLRHGAKIPFVINVIKKADGNISSFTSTICRVLSKYVQKEETGETCPECGEKLIREAGCTKCTNCSYSICMIAYEIEN